MTKKKTKKKASQLDSNPGVLKPEHECARGQNPHARSSLLASSQALQKQNEMRVEESRNANLEVCLLNSHVISNSESASDNSNSVRLVQ